METKSFHPEPSSSDSETDDRSDSFEKRQLIGAETENTELLPDVGGLCISGEAQPGHMLQLQGFCLNGTVRCHFAWLRLYDNGSRIYIPGEELAEHLVTADDVDSYLAVEVIPIGTNGQMGDLVRVFANEHKKVTCGNEIQTAVEQCFFDGHASFDVSLVNYKDDCQSSTVKLELTKDRLIIMNGKLHPIVRRKLFPDVTITIPRERPTGFEIHSSEEYHVLRLEAKSSTLRDLIVLTMRAFLIRATEKSQKKKRSRCSFF